MDGQQLRLEDVPELSPTFLFRWEEAQKAHVLLYPEGIVKLNPSAAAILEACDGRHSIGSIIETLTSLYGDAGIADDIIAFMETARGKGWIRLKP